MKVRKCGLSGKVLKREYEKRNGCRKKDEIFPMDISDF